MQRAIGFNSDENHNSSTENVNGPGINTTDEFFLHFKKKKFLHFVFIHYATEEKKENVLSCD